MITRFYAILADAFSDGRLIIIVTKIDEPYKQQSSFSGETIEDFLQNKVITAMKKAVQQSPPLPLDQVIPICGQWAIVAFQEKDTSKFKREAANALDTYEASEASGQDVSHWDILYHLDTEDLRSRLTKASGISTVKEK